MGFQRAGPPASQGWRGLMDFARVARQGDAGLPAGRKEAAVGGWRLKVLYDGQCPFCRLEMRRLSQRNVTGGLAFEDISAPEFDPGRYGLAYEQVMGVIHAILPDGRISRGLEVFRLAYRAVGLGWLVAPSGWPVLRHIFDGLYALFARYRLPLGRPFGRECARGACRLKREGWIARPPN